GLAAYHEKTTRRIFDISFHHCFGNAAGDTAYGNTSGIPAFHAAFRHVSARDHDIELLSFQTTQPISEEPLVVLQVGIHHCNKGCRGGQDALYAGARETAPSESSNDPYPMITHCNHSRPFSCTVRRVVVDIDDLPVDSC